MKTTWHDLNGTQHSVKITFAVAQALRDAGVIDLLRHLRAGPKAEQDVEFDALTQLLDDPATVFAILGLAEQLDDPAQLAAVLDGDAFEAARLAVLYAVIDFFPPSRRQIWRQLLQSGLQMQTQLTAQATQQIEQALPSIFSGLVDSLSAIPGSGCSDSAPSFPEIPPSEHCGKSSGSMTASSITSGYTPERSVPTSGIPSESSCQIDSGIGGTSTPGTRPHSSPDEAAAW